MVNFTSKRMTLGVKSDTMNFYIMENRDGTFAMDGEVPS